MIDPGSFTDREALVLRLAREPRFAHQFLFKHRHAQATPMFHYEMIDDLHGPTTRLIELAFRGAAKSTLAEEFITLSACFGRFRNFIIIGESATRANERLATVKHELDFNEGINFLFGNLHGAIWNEDKVLLTNGCVIQAFGRLQSLRGTKHDDARPDGCLIDDVEDEESVNTPEGRDKAHRWLLRTLLPALAPGARVRLLANLLDPDCLAVRLERSGTWEVKRYPWEYRSKTDGARRATWPARFPLGHIDRTHAEYAANGMINEYMQEFMVEAIDPSSRAFTADMFKVVPRVRTWEPVYAMYDPARSVKRTASHTGKVVFSWIGDKLIIWEADGQHWMPDQILEDIFRVAETYAPIKIGVEKEGLEEFLLQPIRAEMLRRRCIIPVEAFPAPVGKQEFIRSLRPFFLSGHIELVSNFPVLCQQLLSFPTGKIDVPNALAYALRMRPGLPIYENFGFKNVADDLDLARGTDCCLAVNASRQYTAAVLLQRRRGVTYVLRDWLVEGDPGATLPTLVDEVRIGAVNEKVQAYAPPTHWRPLDNLGLAVVARRARLGLGQGGQLTVGRAALRDAIDRTVGDLSALLVSTRARWTLNALAGGYSASVGHRGEINKIADDGPYKVLMEGLESCFAALAVPLEGDAPGNYLYDATGRKYLSARAQHHGSQSSQIP